MKLNSSIAGRLLTLMLVAGVSIGTPASAQHMSAEADRRLVLVSIDGLRWQEVFRGADPGLINNPTFTKWTEATTARFLPEAGRAEVLMPFLHEVIGKQGVLIGNRDQGSCARITNNWWFSYPGYNELLTGKADPDIDSNASVPNPNVTFLEWLNQQQKFSGEVYAFGSWNVFPYIINTERSGLPVNAGFDAMIPSPNATVTLLNRLLQDIPSPWDTVRLDAFTHHYALEIMRDRQPRVLFIAYGETDDFAHDGDYDQYLFAANRTDRFLRELWSTIQSEQGYKGRTSLIITVDHGRGELPVETWQYHASQEAVKGYIGSLKDYSDGIIGSDQIWLGAIGPDVNPAKAKNYTASNCAGLDQIAASALKALHIDWQEFAPDIGKPLHIFNDGLSDR